MEPFRNDLLSGKSMLITGGGSGLGRAMALRFGGLGARVAVLGRRPQPLDATVADIRKAGGEAVAVPCDIRDSKAVVAAFDAAEAALGPVDSLVNNAAGNFLCPSEELSDNAFDAVVRIVLYGSFYCTRELGRRLVACGRGGSVLSIVTNYAAIGSAFVLPSAVAKAGVAVMTRSLAVEWATYGIRLNAIAPGLIPTEGAFSRLVPHPEIEREAVRRVPLRRFGTPDELASLAAYMLSDASPYQTGDVVTLDGGEALLSGQEFSAFTQLDRAAAKALMAAARPRKE
ncbi:MAG: SDR family oxidoreductase [Acidobacteria bacterium]|nr:SDR family oxidoreductase [Acidobacteriota bacterium]